MSCYFQKHSPIICETISHIWENVNKKPGCDNKAASVQKTHQTETKRYMICAVRVQNGRFLYYIPT